MSEEQTEVKPVYQRHAQYDEWEDISADEYERELHRTKYAVRVIYRSKDFNAAQSRIKELESKLAEAEKEALSAQRDQARYQYLSRKVGAIQTTDGSKYIFVNLPKCGSHVFKGSVAQHFSEAIDAAIKESQQ